MDPSDDYPVGYQVARLDRTFVGVLDKGLARFGLTSPRVGVLLFLHDAPGLTSAELARRAIVTPQTMIRIVTGLEEAGLVERHPDPSDARVLQVRLTPLGRARLKAANAWVEAAEAELVRGESADELTAVSAFLVRARHRMESFEVP